MYPNSIIKVENLVKKYGNFTAVKEINLEVYEGEIFGLLGPNGAGKSSTLEILETLSAKTSGKVTIAGYDLDKDASKIKSLIGVQLQSTEFYRTLNLKEIIHLFCGLYNASHTDAITLLDRVKLKEQAGKKFKELSGGQQQRFSLAVTLINQPRIVFLDEPTTGLDPQSRLSLWEIISQMKKEGITIILTTHYMDEAEKLCDRIGIIDNGHIIAIDTPQNLIQTLLNTGFKKHIEVQEANLEDVFLHYTGKHLRNE